MAAPCDREGARRGGSGGLRGSLRGRGPLAFIPLAALAAAGSVAAALASGVESRAVEVLLAVLGAASVLLLFAVGRAREAIARARESEERARRLFEQGADAIFVLGNGGRILDANLRACELSGYTREELQALPVTQLFPEPHPGAYVRDTEALRRGEVQSDQRVLVRRDGSLRFIDGNTRMLSDGRFEVISRDVSDRVEAQRMEERLRRALDQAVEGVVVFDASERLIYANRAYAKLYGAPLDPRARPTADSLWADPERRAFLEEVRAKARATGIWSGRYEVSAPGGGRSVREGSYALVLGPKGETVGHVGVFRDVTHEVDLEARLRQSEKLEAVGSLAAGVAHDFNNHLTAILGFASLLHLRLEEDPEARGEVEQIREAAEHAAELTAQLLAFARKQALRPEVLDLNDLVRDTSTMLRRVIRENVELALSLAPSLPHVEADPNQLRQVLLNLAANASDAMPRGGRLVIATAEERRAGGVTWVLLSVTDTGEGMDADTRDRIFEPFFTTKAVGEGTGLGLASVHGIVEQSGGTIEVESAPGKGSCFRILLPATARQPAPIEAPAPVPREAPGPRRILVVEDQASVRAVAARALRGAGYEVTEAADGEAALALAGGGPPFDLVVTDVVMARLDGPALAERLRLRFPRLRVLFVSGYSREDTRIPRTGGPDAQERLLLKPFTPQQLVDVVQGMLDR